MSNWSKQVQIWTWNRSIPIRVLSDEKIIRYDDTLWVRLQSLADEFSWNESLMGGTVTERFQTAEISKKQMIPLVNGISIEKNDQLQNVVFP